MGILFSKREFEETTKNQLILQRAKLSSYWSRKLSDVRPDPAAAWTISARR